MEIYEEIINPNLRTPYALWFEYYRLCLLDPELEGAVEKSKDFYAPWGDVLHTSFPEWWETHSYLFDEIEVKAVHRVIERPDTIILQIPLGIPSSVSLKQIKYIIENAQQQRLRDLGVDGITPRKSLKMNYSKYSISGRTEIRIRVEVDVYITYSMWLLFGKPRIGHEFCNNVYRMLFSMNRSKKSLQYIPAPDDPYPNAANEHCVGRVVQFSEDQLRQLRRYIDRGKETVEAVANGHFPRRPNLRMG